MWGVCRLGLYGPDAGGEWWRTVGAVEEMGKIGEIGEIGEIEEVEAGSGSRIAGVGLPGVEVGLGLCGGPCIIGGACGPGVGCSDFCSDLCIVWV